ncbi:MAG: carbohydrate-binding domain-containing protein [Oscillospiraceae bacterium]|nr:carbohydrate-binding domain-containing protein [Oscillospiraceae bacterium]
MKRYFTLLLAAVLVMSLAACGESVQEEQTDNGAAPVDVTEAYSHASHIELSDDMTETPAGVTLSRDIVYYEAGKDFTYGEGTEADEHSEEEAAEHLVVTITEPGDYLLTGTLNRGQIAVDLGEEAKDDPDAVVTLIFGGADISCTVAPAVIFYNVYECGDANSPTKDVDTSAAGANVIIADGTVNTVNGSYVARIYKSVVLSDDGTEVIDSKKLHKYDGAFYSKMSMNVDGGALGNGSLRIQAENEGLDSEMHLTINGGSIAIDSGNDGINTNEDGVSVTTVNGGNLTITVNGSTGEGDGIDSNGWLVINGGTVTAQGCSFSGDAGIDSDMGIYLNGGTVLAAGNMLDRIAGGNANYAVFQLREQKLDGPMQLKNTQGEMVLEWTPDAAYSYVIMSAPTLTEGDYTLWSGDTQLQHSGTAGGFGNRGPMGNMGGMQPPEGFDPENMQRPEGMELPEGFDPENMQRPEGMELPEGFDPENMQRPESMERPEAMRRPEGEDGMLPESGEASEVFTITAGGNWFVM